MSIVTLATDLDGTLIPLKNTSKSLKALSEITIRHKNNSHLKLIFVTGRHLSSILDLYKTIPLPVPDLIICDVGTSIYRYADNSWLPLKKYYQHLNSLIQDRGREDVEESLSAITGLTLQERDKQNTFKISYYVNGDMIDSILQKIKDVQLVKALPYNIIKSIDPFTGEGLIDLLPKGVTKNYALEWLIDEGEIDRETLIFSGDSGNDRDVFINGIKSVVVNNAPLDLKKEIKEEVVDLNKVFFASLNSVEGVLEGCDFFGWK